MREFEIPINFEITDDGEIINTTVFSESTNLQEELSPEQKARDMVRHFVNFARGEKEKFSAYFVLGAGDDEIVQNQRQIERNFTDSIGIPKDELGPSEVPIAIAHFDEVDVTLFKWSNIIDGEPFDVYYQACRGDDKPSIYYGETVNSA